MGTIGKSMGRITSDTNNTILQGQQQDQQQQKISLAPSSQVSDDTPKQRRRGDILKSQIIPENGSTHNSTSPGSSNTGGASPFNANTLKQHCLNEQKRQVNSPSFFRKMDFTSSSPPSSSPKIQTPQSPRGMVPSPAISIRSSLEATHKIAEISGRYTDEEDSSGGSSEEENSYDSYNSRDSSSPLWNERFQESIDQVNKLFEDTFNNPFNQTSSPLTSSKLARSTEDLSDSSPEHPRKIRTSSGSTSSGSGSYLRSSNEELHTSRSAAILQSFSELAELYHNFIDTATLYGKIIISEKYLPTHLKTIKPDPRLGGIAGGEKYCVHNIIFKFSTDHLGLFGSDHNSQKLASLELKGLIHIFNGVSKLGICVPMMMVLDYKGFKLIAMSKLPIHGDDTLVYGSRDAGSTILTDNEYFHDRLKIACIDLGLKPHKVKPSSGSLRSSKASIGGSGSGDNVVNSGSTDNITLSSSPLLLPITPLSSSSSSSIFIDDIDSQTVYTPVDLEGHLGKDGRYYLLDFSRIFPPELPEKSIKCSHLFRLFRPEFVKIYSRLFGPLSPDAFSKFSKGTSTFKEDNSEIDKATKYLINNQIPKFIDELDNFVSIDPFAFVEAFHRNGINIRHLGNARKDLLDRKKEGDIKDNWSKLLLIETLSRTIKNEISYIMRQQVNKQSLPGDQKLKQVISGYLSLVFGESDDSRSYWSYTLKEKLLHTFPNALSSDEIGSANFGQSILKSESICLLFSRTTILSGIRFTSEAFNRFQKPEYFAFENPVDETDIESIIERVKSMSLAAYAKGYTFQMKAIHSRNEKEARRFYQLAVQKFKMALAMEPDHIDSLIHIFDAVVYLGYHTVAQSLYHTLITIDPQHYLFLYKYARFCEKTGNYESAEENYLLSLEYNPNNSLCLIAYGKFLSEHKKNNDIAEKFYQRAAHINSRNCFVLFNYAIFLHQKKKDYSKAEELFMDAINLPDFDNMDEIQLLKDYAIFLKDVLKEDKIAMKYTQKYQLKREVWEKIHKSTNIFINLRRSNPGSSTTTPPISKGTLASKSTPDILSALKISRK